MWQKRQRKGNGASVTVHALLCVIFLALSLVVTIVHRICAGLFVGRLSADDIISNTQNNLWKGLLGALPGLMMSIFVLVGMREGVSSRGVCLILIPLLVFWIVVQPVSVGLLVHKVLAGHLSPILVGIVTLALDSIISTVFIAIASLNCYKKSIYDYVAACTIFGCLVGFSMSFEIESYLGQYDIMDLGAALGRGGLYTFSGTCVVGVSAILISRYNFGYSVWNFVGAIVIPPLAACAIGSAVYYPSLQYEPLISIDAVRYLIAIGVSLILFGLGIVMFRSLRVEPTDDFEDDNLRFAKSLMNRSVIPSSSSDCSQ